MSDNIYLGFEEEIIVVYFNGSVNIIIIRKEIYVGLDIVLVGMMLIGGMNIIGLSLFFIVFGIVFVRFCEKGRLLIEFFCVLNEVVMVIVYFVMW